ncbi:hypothetical protein C8Q74DRAFT_1301418 [Fomes fomentarius]|nr:hypothetical protein C8Q74DRAFT_1301418 [Fomes fomentarius]
MLFRLKPCQRASKAYIRDTKKSDTNDKQRELCVAGQSTLNMPDREQPLPPPTSPVTISNTTTVRLPHYPVKE